LCVPTSRRESRPGSERRPGIFPGLAALLWTVRESLESVLYKLVVVRLVVTDGSPRWLPQADAELRDALDTLRSVEVLRAAEVDDVMQAARKPGRSSLAALVKLAPEPWPRVFAEHRDALRVLVDQIDVATAENKQVLQAAAHRTRMPTGRSGRRATEDIAEVSAAAYRSALATLDTVPQLSLHEFLD
jgi:hypothetical protein